MKTFPILLGSLFQSSRNFLDGFIQNVHVSVMNRTLVNMLQCPKTQIKVEKLGQLW